MCIRLYLFKYANKCFVTCFSITFQITDKTEIGRQLDGSLFGPPLYVGKSFEFLIHCGNDPVGIPIFITSAKMVQ